MDVAWRTLKNTEVSNNVLRQSLKKLYSNRQHLSRISLDNAAALLGVARCADDFSRHACLSLLTRWALEQQRYILAGRPSHLMHDELNAMF
jgi:hypothetical protein